MARKNAVRKKSRKKDKGIRRFTRETIGEIRKVSWPTRSESINLTKVVVIVMIIMAAFLGGLDYLFLQLFARLFETL